MSWDEKLFQRYLTTRRFGRQSRYFPEIDSTNRWLTEHWRDFTLNGAIVIAGHQTGGRGRFKRKWDDVPGHSLLFSLMLSSGELRSNAGFQQMLPAIAFARVAKSKLHADHKIALKWPNDVLLNGYKIAGILAERFTVATRSITVVGMGINVSMRSESFSEEIRDAASSVFAETGDLWERESLLAELLNEWEPLHDLLRDRKLDRIRELWQEFGPAPKSRLVRRESGAELAGSYEGIGESGQLLLRDDTGKLHEFFSGDILL